MNSAQSQPVGEDELDGIINSLQAGPLMPGYDDVARQNDKAKAKHQLRAWGLRQLISELEKLDAQRETVQVESQLFGTVMETYRLPINLLWSRRDELKHQLRQLDQQGANHADSKE